MGDRPYFHSLVLDCAEPRKNADFYAELLAYEVVYADDEWVTIAGPGPMLSFRSPPTTSRRRGRTTTCPSRCTSTSSSPTS